MTTKTFAPAACAASDSAASADTMLELVSCAHVASSRLTVRVLIANHQPSVPLALRDLVENQPDLQVVGETNDGSEAVRLVQQLHPDAVLIDLSMPTVDGISATRMIRAELRDAQVVVMAGVNEDISAIEAIRAGAAAYLLKDARIDDLLRTIRGAGAGQVALPARAAARMVGMAGRRPPSRAGRPRSFAWWRAAWRTSRSRASSPSPNRRSRRT